MTRKQCEKCPWRADVDPRDIPGGYSEDRHEGLKAVMSEPCDISSALSGERRMMACHETEPGNELPCVGWLVQQLGPGNNLGLRMAVIYGDVDGDVETVGPQHERFEDTLPTEGMR